MILVTGGTGTVGRELVAQLASGGQRVRVLVRDPGKAKLPDGAQAVMGDLDKPETLAAAVEGAERVFSLAVGPIAATREANLVRAAKAAGAKHVVKLSVLGAGGQGRSGVATWHDAGEKAIQDSGLAWTFVRPGSFMSNALQWVPTVKGMGKVFSNYGEGKVPPIHPRDIAAVAARALTTAGHEGKAYPLTGPEALSVEEQVRLLADAVGKPIQFVSISDEETRERMVKAGLPPAIVDALLPFGAVVRAGKAAEVLPTVEQVLGRKALTFAQWAKENAAAFG